MGDVNQYAAAHDASRNSIEQSGRNSKLNFSEDEKTLITRMYNLVGERWSLIAGRIPGRSAEEIEKYWATLTRT